MSNRRKRGDVDVQVFGRDATVPLQDADSEIFGAIEAVDRERRDAKPVSIFEIFPDPVQPRRVIPSAVRPYWDGQPQTVPHLFEVWLRAAEAEKKGEIALAGWLSLDYLPDDPGSETEAPGSQNNAEPQSGPVEQALLKLALLAANIRHTGLTNPITVARAGRYYRLETGERRWLAFHLLNTFFPDGGWARIPARMVEQFDVWRQASENGARDDLNAIGKARQLALLLMDLLQERGEQFGSYLDFLQAGRSEREYYAQVADGNRYRIPRGQAERLLGATGLKNPVQIRQYRDLLRLPDEVWRYADDHNLTEWQIRSLGSDTVTAVTVSPKNPRSQPGSAASANPFLEPINKKRHGQIWHFAARLDSLSTRDRDRALRAIEDEKRWLEELEIAIRNRSLRGT